MSENVVENNQEEPKKKRVVGRPFTKENAAEMGARGRNTRKLRKEARDKIFLALVNKLDLGEELIKAIQRGDETLVSVIDKAVKIVGLHYDQSEDAATNIKAEVKSDVKMKVAPALNITFSDAEK
jgi:hypothetical protein